jgi:hypothetical protein
MTWSKRQPPSCRPHQFGLHVQIVGLPNVDESTRLAAAVNFKNSVRSSWVLHEGETPPVVIQDNERVRV